MSAITSFNTSPQVHCNWLQQFRLSEHVQLASKMRRPKQRSRVYTTEIVEDAQTEAVKTSIGWQCQPPSDYSEAAAYLAAGAAGRELRAGSQPTETASGWPRHHTACAIAARLAACKSQPYVFVTWEPLLVLLKQTCHLAVVLFVQVVHSGLLHLRATHTRLAIKCAALTVCQPGRRNW